MLGGVHLRKMAKRLGGLYLAQVLLRCLLPLRPLALVLLCSHLQ